MRKYTDADKRFVRRWVEENQNNPAALADGYRLCSEAHQGIVAASRSVGWRPLSPEDVRVIEGRLRLGGNRRFTVQPQPAPAPAPAPVPAPAAAPAPAQPTQPAQPAPP
eukprot:Hpha_TRINITY_DN8292_c0_g1::TRINITY_DN8292_c0_g1_i1::g.111965::m.111965